MKSLQHVLWRGALALSLVAVGIGSGVGMPPAEQALAPADCPATASHRVADQPRPALRAAAGPTVILPRRAPSPAGQA